MQNLLNLSLVEGRITAKPELLYTKNGHAVCKFDIAVNELKKTGDEYIEGVSFFSVNTWNKVADTCSRFLDKGSKVRVRGRLKQDKWVAKDGSNRSKVHIEAAVVDFLGSRETKDLQLETAEQEQVEQIPY